MDVLAEYWRRAGLQALHYLGRRPLKLVRNVHGIIFYHKGPLPQVPDSVHKLKIEKSEGGEGTRLWVDSVEGLLGLLEIGVIELHPWNATVDDIEHADQLAFDLDPGPGIAWEFVTETALALRDLLQDEGLASWPKVTGGKGFHIVAPLSACLSHDQAHRYAAKVAARLRERHPTRYTLLAALPERRARLFIDYLRNGRGTTAVGAYSPRARAGFPIAAPVTWNDVERGIRSNAFTIKSGQQ
jgi:bifunctional non-homologous end joining protein LigD